MATATPPPDADLPFPLLLLEAAGETGESVQRVHRGHMLEVEGAQLVEHRALARREQAELRCGSSIQSSLPCVLRSSRGVGPLNPKWSSRVGPRRSILAEVNTDGGTLALARTLIAPIAAIANATATSFRITATSTPASIG